MTRVRDAIAVSLPAAATQAQILRYFETRRRAGGGIQIPMRVALRDFGLPDQLAVEREVNFQIEKRRDAENINEEIGIAWAPAGGGPYPSFSGRLIVWSEDDPKQSFIELDGTYEPPLGVAGEAFDETVGHLIAQRTAHEFLLSLRDALSSGKDTT